MSDTEKKKKKSKGKDKEANSNATEVESLNPLYKAEKVAALSRIPDRSSTPTPLRATSKTPRETSSKRRKSGDKRKGSGSKALSKSKNSTKGKKKEGANGGKPTRKRSSSSGDRELGNKGNGEEEEEISSSSPSASSSASSFGTLGRHSMSPFSVSSPSLSPSSSSFLSSPLERRNTTAQKALKLLGAEDDFALERGGLSNSGGGGVAGGWSPGKPHRKRPQSMLFNFDSGGSSSPAGRRKGLGGTGSNSTNDILLERASSSGGGRRKDSNYNNHSNTIDFRRTSLETSPYYSILSPTSASSPSSPFCASGVRLSMDGGYSAYDSCLLESNSSATGSQQELLSSSEDEAKNRLSDGASHNMMNAVQKEEETVRLYNLILHHKRITMRVEFSKVLQERSRRERERLAKQREKLQQAKAEFMRRKQEMERALEEAQQLTCLKMKETEGEIDALWKNVAACSASLRPHLQAVGVSQNEEVIEDMFQIFHMLEQTTSCSRLLKCDQHQLAEDIRTLNKETKVLQKSIEEIEKHVQVRQKENEEKQESLDQLQRINANLQQLKVTLEGREKNDKDKEEIRKEETEKVEEQMEQKEEKEAKDEDEMKPQQEQSNKEVENEKQQQKTETNETQQQETKSKEESSNLQNDFKSTKEESFKHKLQSLQQELNEGRTICQNYVQKRITKRADGDLEEFLYTYRLDDKHLNDDSNDIKFNPATDNVSPPSVRAATANRLVERLAHDIYTDPNFLKAFMLTYRSFLSPVELLEKLVFRYLLTPQLGSKINNKALIQVKKQAQSVIQLRVLVVLKFWIENFFHDFDPPLIDLCNAFLALTIPIRNLTIVDNLKEMLQNLLVGIPPRGRSATQVSRKPTLAYFSTAPVSEGSADSDGETSSSFSFSCSSSSSSSSCTEDKQRERGISLECSPRTSTFDELSMDVFSGKSSLESSSLDISAPFEPSSSATPSSSSLQQEESNSGSSIQSIKEENYNSSGLQFMELDPDLVAQQMTLFEFEIYQRIEAKELFSQRWNKNGKEFNSPNVLELIHNFNKISNWVCGELVLTPDFALRCTKMKKFILIANECYKLKNFNGALEIIAGLSNSAVHRLRKTWEEIGESYTSIYNQLKELMNNNYSRLRQELRSTAPPCLPYLGVFLTDLTFLEDGNPDRIEGGELINFNKMRSVAEKIREVQQYQNKCFSFPEDPLIQKYLRNIKQVDEDKIYQISLKVETRKLNKFFG